MKYLISLALIFSIKVLAQTSVMPVYDQGIYPSKNYVKNPSCSKNVANITASGGSLAKNTSTPLDKSSDCAIDASSSGQTYTFAVNTMDNSLKGSNCQANFIYTGDASLYKAYVNINSVKVTSDLQLLNSGSGVSKPVKIFFPCGDLSTATTVVIESTSASAAAINVAKVYAGEAYDLSNQPAPAEFVGSLNYAGVANCTWDSATSTSYTDFSADSDCNSATVTGSVIAPAGKTPSFTLNVKPGTYKFIAKAGFSKASSSNVTCDWRFSDGTNVSASNPSYTTGAQNIVPVIEGQITYTTSGQKTINIQGANDGSSVPCQIYSDVAGKRELNIDVYYYPSSSQQAIRQDCVGTVDCENVFSLKAATPSGAACVVSAESVDWVNGNAASGSTGTCTFTLNTSAFSAAPNCTCSSVDPGYLCNVTSASTTTVVTQTYVHSGAATDVAVNLSCQRQLSDRKPQTNAPLLVGSVTSSSTGADKIVSGEFYTTTKGTVCSSSPCTITGSDPAVSSVTRTGTGDYTINFVSGTFSAKPQCFFTLYEATGGSLALTANNQYQSSNTASAYRITTTNGGNNSVRDSSAEFFCKGPR